MSNAVIPYETLSSMADAFAKSGLFGAKTPEQALALLLLAQGEGLHPAIAMRDFDIIQGRPAKKSEAMLRSFIAAGGKVEWHQMTDTVADATFSHPQGGSARIAWDMDRAKTAGIGGKDNWKKYPRQMLANRVISEGCRRIYPASTSGLYIPEEVADFRSPEKDITPSAGVLQSLTHKEQNVIHEIASQIKAHAEADNFDAAYTLWSDSDLDADKTVALFSLLPTKLKNTLGKMRDREREQNSALLLAAMSDKVGLALNGEDLNAVAAEIEEVKPQMVKADVETLRARFKERRDEIAQAA